MEPLADYAARIAEPYEGRQNRTVINRIFREYDDSHKWPINDQFDATERAIKRVQKFMRDSGCDLQGLEYALTLDREISNIVNDPKL